jgi:hypothetical protein
MGLCRQQLRKDTRLLQAQQAQRHKMKIAKTKNH